MTDSGIPDEVRAMIGVGKTRTYQVTAREVRRFAQAIGETDPRHQDEGLAATTDQGALVAPPLFTQTYTYDDVDPSRLPPDGSPIELDVPIPATRAVGGGSEYEIFRTVRAGDVLTVTSRLQDVYAKEGRSGRLYFVVVETDFRDPEGLPVAREVATYIKRS